MEKQPRGPESIRDRSSILSFLAGVVGRSSRSVGNRHRRGRRRAKPVVAMATNLPQKARDWFSRHDLT